MHYVYLVTVDTDYANIDAPDAVAISNEIQNALEFEAHAVGITGVDVRSVDLTLILSLLDDMATRPTTMGIEDVDDLCEARESLARLLNAPYNPDTNRHTEGLA